MPYWTFGKSDAGVGSRHSIGIDDRDVPHIPPEVRARRRAVKDELRSDYLEFREGKLVTESPLVRDYLRDLIETGAAPTLYEVAADVKLRCEHCDEFRADTKEELAAHVLEAHRDAYDAAERRGPRVTRGRQTAGKAAAP